MTVKLKRWSRARGGYSKTYPYLDPRRLLSELGLKTCPKCKKEKRLNEFYRAKRSTSGRTSWCKVCREERRRELTLLHLTGEKSNGDNSGKHEN